MTSPSLSSFYVVGQFLRVAIVSLQALNHHRIAVSTRESLVNHGLALSNFHTNTVVVGSVKSVEDHGFLINFGLAGEHADVTGFLPKKLAANYRPDALTPEPPLQVGQPLSLVIKSVKETTKIVTLTAYYARVKDTMVLSLSFRLPFPGFSLLAERECGSDVVQHQARHVGVCEGAYCHSQEGVLMGQIEKLLPNGLWVKFLGYFGGTIDLFHLPKTIDFSEIASSFKVRSSLLPPFPTSLTRLGWPKDEGKSAVCKL